MFIPPIKLPGGIAESQKCAQCEKYEGLLHEILNDQYTDFRQSLADKAHALLAKVKS